MYRLSKFSRRLHHQGPIFAEATLQSFKSTVDSMKKRLAGCYAAHKIILTWLADNEVKRSNSSPSFCQKRSPKICWVALVSSRLPFWKGIMLILLRVRSFKKPNSMDSKSNSRTFSISYREIWTCVQKSSISHALARLQNLGFMNGCESDRVKRLRSHPQRLGWSEAWFADVAASRKLWRQQTPVNRPKAAWLAGFDYSP